MNSCHGSGSSPGRETAVERRLRRGSQWAVGWWVFSICCSAPSARLLWGLWVPSSLHSQIPSSNFPSPTWIGKPERQSKPDIFLQTGFCPPVCAFVFRHGPRKTGQNADKTTRSEPALKHLRRRLFSWSRLQARHFRARMRARRLQGLYRVHHLAQPRNTAGVRPMFTMRSQVGSATHDPDPGPALSVARVLTIHQDASLSTRALTAQSLPTAGASVG